MTVGAVIGIAGFKGSGKTSFAEAFCAQDGDGQRWIHDSFAAPIRQFMCNLFDINLRDLDVIKESPQPFLGGRSPRQVMQLLGTEWMRGYCGERVWIDALYCRIRKPHEAGCNFVISDVRFENEAKFIRGLGGVVIWIDRPGVGGTDAHVSERRLPAHLIDYLITNDRTLEDLEVKARVIASLV